MDHLVVRALITLLSFCFAKKKDSNQEKGDFFPKAPPEKRGFTLLTHRAIGLGGAGFLPMACYYRTFRFWAGLLVQRAISGSYSTA